MPLSPANAGLGISPEKAGACFVGTPMNKLMWYPWYWERWQANYGVTRLSYAERGLYRELLDASWKRGGLPQDDALLADLSRGRLADFRKHWKAVKRFWHVRDDGLLWNKELEEVRAEQEAAHAKRVEAGRKGGFSKALAMPSNAKQSLAIEKSRVETTLTTAKGGRRFQAAPPSPVAMTLASTLPDLVGTPPTPEQAAEFAAVKSALRGNR